MPPNRTPYQCLSETRSTACRTVKAQTELQRLVGSSRAVDAIAPVLPPNIAISLAATTLAVKGVLITLREGRPDVVAILPCSRRTGIVTRPVHGVLLVAAPVGNAYGLAPTAGAVGYLRVTLRPRDRVANTGPLTFSQVGERKSG